MADVEILYKAAGLTALKYIQNNIPMDETITKLAQDANLTDEEIKRLVELSNSKVYSEVRKSSPENVCFETADFNRISNRRKEINTDLKKKEVEEKKNRKPASGTYDAPPVRKMEMSKKANAVVSADIPVFDKMARASTENALRSLDSFIEQNLFEFKNKFMSIIDYVKKLLKSGVSVDEIKNTICAGDKSGAVWKRIVLELGETFPLIKQASGAVTYIDRAHPVIAEIVGLDKIASDIEAGILMDRALTDILEKQALKLSTVGKAVIGAGVAGVAYNMGAKSSDQVNNINKIQTYKNLRPGGLNV